MTAPGSALFSLGVEGVGTRIVRYEGDMGSGVFTEIKGVTYAVSHDFVTAGSCPVKARVTDDLGRTAEASLLYPAAGQDASARGGVSSPRPPTGAIWIPRYRSCAVSGIALF